MEFDANTQLTATSDWSRSNRAYDVTYQDNRRIHAQSYERQAH